MVFKLGDSVTVPLNGLSLDNIPLHTIWVSPGTFMMGSPRNELWRDKYYDEDPFQAIITQGYWLGKYPITQAQWQAVMKSNPSGYSHCSDCPIENIDWHLAIAFCEVLNNQFIAQMPKGYLFSLPTETQWEYACRAGTQTVFYNGDSIEKLSEIAWYSDNSDKHPWPVGEKQANDWGFHDMLGNVNEWCYDIPMSYPRSAVKDWIAEGEYYNTLRIIRGGSYGSTLSDGSLKCSARTEALARRPFNGFRVCLRQTFYDIVQSKN